ncbi:MAG: hypothetical protein IT290_01320 [Deltaproteobacteria bacterium]|nr:hypothetical protein [Deltaproteobacteria bacterium]
MRSVAFFLLIILTAALPAARADVVSDHPIVFVTMVPNPADFGTLAATFGNHVPNPNTAYRGGDLWIRYADGTLRNLTLAGGYGTTGFQGANAIAVRDPAVHFDGNKIIFSMVVGAPTQQYQLTSHRWQLYEVTSFGPSETPVITKVANQPSTYNNHSPAYASDDTIIFVTDRPRDDTVLHTYPQRDEYESSPVNSGLWKLNPQSGSLVLLDHSPSGDFNPIIDSFGRVVFTRWDHLQRDQQNVGASLGAFNFQSETSTVATSSAAEVFPEARSNVDPDKRANVNLFTINQFFPWAMNQDGTDLETLQHIGRQEVGLYVERNFNDDPNVQEFYGQYDVGQNENDFTIFLHIKENPLVPGTYFGTSCQEFGTHSAGQIISISGSPSTNAENVTVNYLTHPDTSGATDTPSGNHSGLYRDPLPLSNGVLIAAHTANTRQDTNIGTGANPLSRYDFRLKVLSKPGAYYSPSAMVTSGISKSVQFWSPDQSISYNGLLWEMMPVEVKTRPRPAASTLAIPAPEAQVIASMGVSVDELTSYLRSQNLALIVTRNVTTRDHNDRQQPTNLRVPGTTTQSIPRSGKVYDVSHLEVFQGDLIRGYTQGNNTGRRVIAQRMHSVGSGVNLPAEGAAVGAVQVAADGSVAAFVPARRALTWQMSSPDGTPVVRERYWLTFQPGEIRVCASCHGVNTADHLGNPAPTNPPQALANLLAHWKNLPIPNPTPDPPGSGYSLSVTGASKSGARFQIAATGQSGDVLKLKASVNGKSCSMTKTFSASKTLRGKFPKVSRGRIGFTLHVGRQRTASARSSLRLGQLRAGQPSMKSSDACNALMRSLR